MLTKLIDGWNEIQCPAGGRDSEKNSRYESLEHGSSLVKLALPAHSARPICDRTHISADLFHMTTAICLWSGPRNVSTALMYSFAQRSDIQVVDEPLYGHYLHISGADHPGREDVLAAMRLDGDAVMQAFLEQQAQPNSKRLFLKHMAHHLVDMNLGFLQQTCNVFLIRDPREMLPSLTIQVPHAQLADTGLRRQWRLFSDMQNAGQQALILDSRELLLDPPGVLAALCEKIDLEFDEKMLHWTAGSIPEDGIWAPHWYHAVHQSTGFDAYVKKTNFPDHLQALLAECAPWYERLFKHAIRARKTGDI